ncbi:LOW QUALITY PROTEIN: hypothetical protein Dda_2343 [Drechslerella dactyloides]|uniref:Uncharacterized protein n=1 Tax=Drechslerella dactyloides TaxID=74499 RepID=A0AAD6J7D0_DREDA|nr:LOW QUALITY PROTEIN: hypothetical protein Dda_2343 [Drechslerella dactyloides]
MTVERVPVTGSRDGWRWRRRRCEMQEEEEEEQEEEALWIRLLEWDGCLRPPARNESGQSADVELEKKDASDIDRDTIPDRGIAIGRRTVRERFVISIEEKCETQEWQKCAVLGRARDRSPQQHRSRMRTRIPRSSPNWREGQTNKNEREDDISIAECKQLREKKEEEEEEQRKSKEAAGEAGLEAGLFNI